MILLYPIKQIVMILYCSIYTYLRFLNFDLEND